ncbi:MAG TPA: hypothetical protein PLV12_07910 [Saprospiraceae bacterium]|nr:hypothetical protein [Saprospiraceae bacterium]
MFKYLIIILIIGYVFRRFLFTPLNAPVNKEEAGKSKEKPGGFTNKAGEYTDYEEIK